MKILALDTATEVCSVALLTQSDGQPPQISTQELPAGPQHSAHILSLVQALLAEAGISLSQLDCIAFGRGPGGFTGVRLAASVTQGLAFGAGLGVVPVSDLLAVAQQVVDLEPTSGGVLVCNDARMQEVYWGCARRGPGGLAETLGPERVGIPDSVELPTSCPAPLHGAGKGFTVFPSLLARLGGRLAGIHAELLPRAAEIVRLAAPQWQAGQAVAPEQAQPVYLRDNVAKPSRK